MSDTNPQNNPVNIPGNEDTANNTSSTETSGSEKISIPRLRTFSDDLQSAVRSGNFSQANMVMAEKKRARERGEKVDTTDSNGNKTKNVGLIIGYVFVILLFISGGVGIFIFFQSNNAAVKSTSPQTNTPSGFLAMAPNLQLLLEESDNKPQIITKMEEVLAKVGAEDFTRINPTNLIINDNKRADTPISLEDLFERLLIFDVGFARLTSKYTYGVHKGEHPFLLVQLDDPIESYARLFSWEGRMQTDLLPFFPELNEEKEIVVEESVPEVTTAILDAVPDATTAIPGNQPIETDATLTPEPEMIQRSSTPEPEMRFIYNPRAAQFSDGVFFNFEGRVVRDSNNKVRLVYALITKNLLVITSNPETLRAISVELKNTTIVR